MDYTANTTTVTGECNIPMSRADMVRGSRGNSDQGCDAGALTLTPILLYMAVILCVMYISNCFKYARICECVRPPSGGGFAFFACRS